MFFKLWKVFVLIMASQIVAALSKSCCPEGQYYVRGKRCWDYESNTTEPMTALQCKHPFPWFAGYKENEAGDLELYLPANHVEIIKASEFCYGNFTKIREANISNSNETVVVCTTEPEQDLIDYKIVAYCMIISVIFLAATVVVYAGLAELRDLHGKSLICLCLSLGLALSILSGSRLVQYSDMNLCAARGFLIYFFLIASFFWSNSIAIQILRNTRYPTISDYGWREFTWYSVYAWGVPALFTIIMAIVNYHPGSHPKPGIGLNHCWFISTKQQWYYMYSVMTILLVANICIFIYTSVVIWRHTFISTHTKALKYKFILTTRLIIVLGLPWVFEMISNLSKKHIIWVILDLLNALQGFLIFLLLVVFRRRVLKAMHKQGWLDCISGPVEKFLAAGDDDEENVVQHTDLPMIDANGR